MILPTIGFAVEQFITGCGAFRAVVICHFVLAPSTCASFLASAPCEFCIGLVQNV